MKSDKEKANKDKSIIVHLPIKLSDIENEKVDSIFLKDQSDYYNLEIDELKEKIKQLNHELETYKNIDDKNFVSLNSKKKSKCWWCKHTFDCPKVELPEIYFNKTFHCIGQFCSYNCAKSYSIDLNDENVFKRNSLLQYKYKLTYKEDIEIKPAPSWKVLKEFGGILSIEEFRKNFNCNTLNYSYLRPPIISRYSHIEIDNKNKKIEKKFNLKRSKPIESSKYSLENTMGLKITK